MKILGLDLGITSVGWGIIDENYKIIDAGVRLFEEGTAANNETRRSMRQSRRILRRRKARIARMYKYLEEIGIIDHDFSYLENPYEIRVKGLTKELNKNELATALLHLSKRRGFNYETVEDDKAKSEYQKIIQKNISELKEGLYVSQIQLNRLNNEGKIRGSSNIFNTNEYVNETNKILSNQPYVTEEQKNRITQIIRMRRDFTEGPGSLSQPSPYGRFRIVDNDLKLKIVNNFDNNEKAKYLKESFITTYEGVDYKVFNSGNIVNKNPYNLIELMKGKCSLYPEEPRASRNSYSAELHNFLNDLNNMTFFGDKKISLEQKEMLIKQLKTKGSITFNDVLKLFDLNSKGLHNVTGYRIKVKSGAPDLTDFKGFKRIFKVYKQLNLDLPSDDLLDSIADVLTVYKTIEDRFEKLANLELGNEEIDQLSLLTGFSNTHSFSYKALRLLNKELLETNKNQQEIIIDNDLRKEKTIDLISEYDDVILNPVVKRVQREAFKVIEALVRKYGEFDRIVVETTREKNSIEQKKNITAYQKYRKELKEEAEKTIADRGYSDALTNRGSLIEKITLYNSQDGKCAYTGISLDIDRLIADPFYYEVDHIIPISISFDNSMNNKVLVVRQANQVKKNKTPFMYFKTGDIVPGSRIQNYKEFKIYVESNSNYSTVKKQNLLFKQGLDKYVQLDVFRNRNLVDTSYAIRVFMNNLKTYIQTKKYNTTVLTIKGKQTSLFRSMAIENWYKKNSHLEDKENPFIKNRDYYKHHAIDALIIAGLTNQNAYRKLIQRNYDDLTGELIENSPFEDSSLYKFYNTIEELKDDDFKYSWKIDSKPNRQVAVQTIYSTRALDGKEIVINKHNDIYELDKTALDKLFPDKGNSSLLMYRHDRATYEILKAAYIQYKHEKYPFKAYKENHGPLRKYAKKGNGPLIKAVKYERRALGNHIEVDRTKNKKVVLLTIKPYRMDVYEFNNTYKFVTVTYSDIRFSAEKNKYIINEEGYNKKLKVKGINEKFSFKFSIYKNNIIEIITDDVVERGRLVGVGDDSKNKIEINIIQFYYKPQIFKTIGKKVSNITKFNVSPIGEYKKVISEDLKLEI